MLTRLEVDGFKNLVDFTIELGPFTCIAGKNASGKSNIFDAIQFISLLASESLMEAAQSVRRAGDERSGDPRDLFTSGPDGRVDRMRFAAEMVVQPTVEDDLGESAQATITFLRYEVEIGYENPGSTQRTGRLILLREDLSHINIGEARDHLPFEHSASRFRKEIIRGRRFGKAFISTAESPQSPVIRIHGDAGSRGIPRPASATRARSTVLSTVTTVGDPTILAAKLEMVSWRRLALEPSSLRAADDYSDPSTMADDGRHLPASLARLGQQRTDLGLDDTPESVYARIASRLEALDGIQVNRLWVEDDPARELLSIRVSERGGATLAARSLSEGTLRFLALCVLLEDPTVNGLICMEEPENGIHPENIRAIVGLVRELAVDPFEVPGPDNPLRQILINTHSPLVVQMVRKPELLLATTRTVNSSCGTVNSLALLPMRETWRASRTERAVSLAELLAYLAPPADAEIEVDWEQLALL